MESQHKSWLPSLISTSHIALFSLLSAPTLASDLHAALLAAARAPDDEAGRAARARVDFAFIDAATIVSDAHLLTAIWQAQTALGNGAQKAKSNHAEIIYRLGINNNIGDALRTFGLTPTTTHLILVRLGPPDQQTAQVLEEMRSLLPNAELLPLRSLGLQAPSDGALTQAIADRQRITKAYKLHTVGGQRADVDLQQTEMLVLGAVAAKSIAA